MQFAKLDALLIPDPAFAATPLAWLRNAPTAPKPDHVRALLDRLRRVREIGVPPEAAGRIHEDRFQQLIREARISDAHQMGRYTVQRRRDLVASVIDLETRLTDAALDMADKLIGGLFARARKARERRYVVGTNSRSCLFTAVASLRQVAWRRVSPGYWRRRPTPAAIAAP